MKFAGRALRLVADDLTGALDAAAPFASPERPVGLVLHETQLPDRDMLTISTESRDGTMLQAQAATARACHVLNGAKGGRDALWFHKVDSVLRGHPFATTATMMQCLRAAKCLFAPAFPAMGRITRNGMHLVWNGQHWDTAAQSDIAAGLKAVGLNAVLGSSQAKYVSNVTIVDASEQADLDQAVARQEDDRLLWVGSRALAESLAGHAAPLICPQLGIVLVGTTHVATRRQVDLAIAQTEPAGSTGPIPWPDSKCLLIDPVPICANEAATAAALFQAALRITAKGLRGRAMFVTGGNTLSVVLAAIAARSLDCIGEVGLGLPLSIVRGGTLDGCYLISKSGGFGSPDLLTEMLSASMPRGAQ